MKPTQRLSDFVRDGLRAGHGPDEHRTALERAGWSGADIDSALAVWIDGGMRLPVPRPRPSVSGRELVMFALFAITLVVVIWHLVQLSFALIEAWLPGPDRPGGGRAHGSIRWSVSTLVVVLPLFAWLTWRVESLFRGEPGLGRSPIEMRFGVLAMLLAILVLIGDAVAVIYAALSGDLTVQFLAKAMIVAVVAGLLVGWFRDRASEA